MIVLETECNDTYTAERLLLANPFYQEFLLLILDDMSPVNDPGNAMEKIGNWIISPDRLDSCNSHEWRR